MKAKKQVILCVDDEIIILTGLKKQLKVEMGDNFMIETAESGDEALEVYEDLVEDGYEVSVVISDYIMPGMKGDEFLQKMYQQDPSTINIMLTGQADLSAVGNAINNANLYRYITKPWDTQDFTLTVKEAVKKFNQDKHIETQNKELEELNAGLEKKVIERTHELEKANNEISKTLELVSQQKEKIEKINTHITDSINYAGRIQKAVLPRCDYLNEILPQHFVIYKPRDIVSGDFYKASVRGNKFIFTAADCTGHGVPGAIMSMLGTSFLNKFFSTESVDTPDTILGKMRSTLKDSLQQTGEKGESKDGMDLALCVVDMETLQMQFSGANISLFISRSKSENVEPLKKHLFIENEGVILARIKADPQPIGIHLKETNFTLYQEQLLPTDTLYMFSDGFQDQIGGEKGRKYMIKQLKDVLLTISQSSMKEQKLRLESEFSNWKGMAQSQTDDILVAGFRPQFN